MSDKTYRKVMHDFSPVDGCAPQFYHHSIMWVTGATLEVIENVGTDLLSVRAMPNGRILTAKLHDVTRNTVEIKRKDIQKEVYKHAYGGETYE